MTCHAFVKILALVISISLLAGGMVPTNATCGAVCCRGSTDQASHFESKPSIRVPFSSCCTGSETTSCPLLPDLTGEYGRLVISAVVVNENPAGMSYAVSPAGVFSPPPSSRHRADLLRLSGKGKILPLYLKNLSLLV